MKKVLHSSRPLIRYPVAHQAFTVNDPESSCFPICRELSR